MATTKIERLKSHLRTGKSITQLEALGLYGMFRLAARVHELKQQGWNIVTDMREDENGNPYARYHLAEPKTVLPERYRGGSYSQPIPTPNS